MATTSDVVMTVAGTNGLVRERAPAQPVHLRRLWRLPRSRGLALGLLSLILAAAAVGTLLPQVSLTPPREYAEWKSAHALWAPLAEAAGLTRVYTSWWFVSLLGALFLSLLVCTTARAREIWKLDRVRYQEGRAVPLSVRLAGNPVAVSLNTDAEASLQRAAAAVRAAGFRVRRDLAAPRLFAEQCRLGVWGSVVLHLSLMVILLGGVYSGAGKFAGYIDLAEGQTFTDRHEGYYQIEEGPLFAEQHQGFQMRLDRFQLRFSENGKLQDVTSAVTLRSASGELQRASIGIDRPLGYQGATIYQARLYGFSALFALKDRTGKVVDAGLVNFPLPIDLQQPATNSFPIPGTSIRADTDFYPVAGAGLIPEEAWRRERSEQPWVHLFLRDEENRVVFQGPLRPGESAPFGGYSLSFVGVSRWAGFPIVRDPGLPVIFVGFALCVLGAAITYLWIPRRVWAWTETDGAGRSVLCIGGRADKFQPALDEELEELARRIKDEHGST